MSPIRALFAMLAAMLCLTPVAARAATGAAPAEIPLPVSEKPATLIVSTFDGEAQLHFDPAMISEEYLSRVAVLGPYLAPARGGFDGVCGVNEAGEDYYCDLRLLRGADLELAETELDDVVSLLGDLAGVSVPSELDAVLAYVRRETAFYVCLRRAALAYYRGDDSALSVVCEEVDASAACPEFVVRAPLTRTPELRYRLVDFGWQGCMQERFEATVGLYPIENWRMFLRNNGIDEEIVERHGC
jgi:hypothetical protein